MKASGGADMSGIIIWNQFVRAPYTGCAAPPHPFALRESPAHDLIAVNGTPVRTLGSCAAGAVRCLKVIDMMTGLLSRALPALLAASLLPGCALTVRTDVNRAAYQPGQCHTFAFVGSFRTDNALRGTVANPVNESRLRAAITSHMQAIGVQPATANADCLVGYGIGSNLVVNPGYYPYGGYWGWGGYWGPYYGGWYGPYVYREGMIGIDLFNAKTHEALWHASVDQDLYGAAGADAEQRTSRPERTAPAAH